MVRVHIALLAVVVCGCGKHKPTQKQYTIAGRAVNEVRLSHIAYGDVSQADYDPSSLLSELADANWREDKFVNPGAAPEWTLVLYDAGREQMRLKIVGRSVAVMDGSSQWAQFTYWVSFEKELCFHSQEWREALGR